MAEEDIREADTMRLAMVALTGCRDIRGRVTAAGAALPGQRLATVEEAATRPAAGDITAAAVVTRVAEVVVTLAVEVEATPAVDMADTTRLQSAS
jgi:hypothetical protein